MQYNVEYIKYCTKETENTVRTRGLKRGRKPIYSWRKGPRNQHMIPPFEKSFERW